MQCSVRGLRAGLLAYRAGCNNGTTMAWARGRGMPHSRARGACAGSVCAQQPYHTVVPSRHNSSTIIKVVPTNLQ